MNDKINTISWYTLSVEEVQEQLHSDIEKGITAEQILLLREKYGKNEFAKGKQITVWTRIYTQFKSPLVIILLLAGLTTLVLGEYLDMFVIFTAVLINLVVGYFQENRAESAFEKLTESQEKFATVIRDEKKHLIPAEELVPGDTIIIESGMYVPADIRLVETKSLMLNESALTGEWIDVPKDRAQIEKEVSITEQYNMAWMGTFVTSGSGLGFVVGTGSSTEIGLIADELSSTEEELIPLQKNIKRLAMYLTYIVIASIFIILLAGLARGHDIFEMILMAVAIAVAVMPEGLPAAVTVVLAVGMESILKKGGLVRNLLAAETLGNTTVILTDKTGTLTKAIMHVSDIITHRSLTDHDITNPTSLKNAYVKNNKDKVLSMALMVADAFVETREDNEDEWVVRGRPVERAVVSAGIENGLAQATLFVEEPRLDYLAFESERRFAASLHHMGGTRSKKRRVYITGSPELLLEHATHISEDNKKIHLTKPTRKALEDIQKAESSQGMRLVGVAYRDVSWNSFEDKKVNVKETETFLEDTIFAGFLVLHDPMRENVREAIETAHKAGTTVIMLTGDNPITAGRIAKEAGITDNAGGALTGTDIEKMDDDTLYKALNTSKVFARVLPKQKLRIARLLKSKNEIVAMTGDGINDAPALRSADIGISLGSGTEVAKEASDLVLIDDSFSIIIGAIEEGRRIRDNLKKIITYLLSTSFSELLIVGGAIVMGLQLPILPAQILWINIIQEGFMNFAFAFEPAEKDVMTRNPKSDSMKLILTTELKKLIGIIAFSTGAVLMIIYFMLLHYGTPIEQIRTIIFVVLSVASLFFTFSIKDLHQPIWKINLFSNRYLMFAFFASIGALVLALEFGPLQRLLQLESLSRAGYALLFGIGVVNLVIIEVAKYIVFRKKKRKN